MVASGPSMDHIVPSFFAGRVVVGVNEAWRRFPCTYAVRKEHENAQETIGACVPLVIARGDCGGHRSGPPLLAGECYVFDHACNLDDGPVDLSTIGTDRLVVSWSTVTTAIHLAAYLGARAVFVCGHDCGTIDGSRNYDGYYTAPADEGWSAWYEDWLGRIEEQTMEVAARVTEVYGCPVVGLNPWPSLALAGHVHEGRCTTP